MKKIIAFVPARGGSTRVSRKNLQKIGELPLFLRACYNLNQILPKDQIVVDSDDDEILELAEYHNFNSIKRPKELATNATDGNSFFRWETSNFQDADIYIQHLPPMPFLSKDTLKKAIELVTVQGKDSIVAGGKEHFYLWNSQTLEPCYDLNNIPNSYTLNETIFETMGLYIITKEAHVSTGRRIGNNYDFLELPKIEQIDIDYIEDLELAQAIESGLSETSPYKSKNLSLKSKIDDILNAKAIICDVDGVLTDGKMVYSQNGDQLKNFNTRDGIAAKLLKNNNFKLALFSSSINDKLIQNRGEFLGFDVIDVGLRDKLERLEKIREKLNVTYDNIIYIGDDINDLKAMDKCKISICPSDAHKDIKNKVDWVLESKGGEGCLREVCDYILERRK